MITPTCSVCGWRGVPTLDLKAAQQACADHSATHRALFTVEEIKEMAR